MNFGVLHNGMYRLEEKVAVGGFATVYRATINGSNETVAIKISKGPHAQALMKEANILQWLDHENIVRLRTISRPGGKADVFFDVAYGFSDSAYFFVMEYLAGGTLNYYIDRVGALTAPEAAAIGLKLVESLEYMRNADGYSHNDLKLENVVFRQEVREGEAFSPVLIDFGIASRIRVPTETTYYITPPEQIALQEPSVPPEFVGRLDRTKIDVWGMGIVLYCMLGGELPFRARSPKTLGDRITTSHPIPLTRLSADVPPEVNELVLDGCLAKDPRQRISIEDVGKALLPWGKGVKACSVPPKRASNRGLRDRVAGVLRFRRG